MVEEDWERRCMAIAFCRKNWGFALVALAKLLLRLGVFVCEAAVGSAFLGTLSARTFVWESAGGSTASSQALV